MPDIEQLREAVRIANRNFHAAERAERAKNNAALVGRCFRFRNNGSCPEKRSDFWWLYAKITKVDKDGRLIAFEFQINKYGEFDCRPNVNLFCLTDGYRPIPEKQFDDAWAAFKSKLKTSLKERRP